MSTIKTLFKILLLIKKYGVKLIHQSIIRAKINGDFVPNGQEKLDKLFKMLDDDDILSSNYKVRSAKLKEAQSYLNELEKEFGCAPVLSKAQGIIDTLED